MSDFVVIGGGIIGLLSALSLRERGADVVVVDAEQGQSASWAGGGILSALYPWDYPDELTRLTCDAKYLYQQWLQRLDPNGGAADVLHKGGVWLAVTTDEQAQALAWAEQWSLSAQPLCTSALEHSPDTLADSNAGVLMPDVANIRNPRLLALLRNHVSKTCRALKANVVSIERLGHGFNVGLSDGGRVYGKRALIAGGYRSGLIKGGPKLPSAFPAKGEMLFYNVPSAALKHVILTRQGYVIPRVGNGILVGSTLRPGDSSLYPTVAGRYFLEELAHRLYPPLRQHKPTHHWAGVRPGSAQSWPWLGEVPDQPGLFVATGHYRNGLVAAPASATLIAQLMCNETPFIDPAPYALPSSSSASFFSR